MCVQDESTTVKEEESVRESLNNACAGVSFRWVSVRVLMDGDLVVEAAGEVDQERSGGCKNDL